ncbi:MAG TPA: tetratricopeptide repeat protein [Pseudobdellovibrionaceae bacterium]|nr:tetratricopeptide repeat protein [Pseudobdellovibrionaceae bacterium]
MAAQKKKAQQSALSGGMFASVLLILAFGFVGLRQLASQGTHDRDALIRQLEVAQQARAQAELREQLALQQVRELGTQVATVLPAQYRSIAKDARTYQARAIASVTNAPELELKIERASSLLERAKADFRAQNFETSNKRLSDLIRSYPDSIHGPEARFLLVEGLYRSRDFETCIETIEEMLRLYPESELTGFALLRLAKIYELRDRMEDAADVYRSILQNYPQNEIKMQAKMALKRVDL